MRASHLSTLHVNRVMFTWLSIFFHGELIYIKWRIQAIHLYIKQPIKAILTLLNTSSVKEQWLISKTIMGSHRCTGLLQYGHLDIVQYLHAQGADIEKADNEGRTPLHACCERGHLHIAEYLVSQGADVNRAMRDGMTALHACCAFGHLDIAEYLVSQGADVNRAMRDGRTALHVAAGTQTKGGHLHVVNYLIRKGVVVDKQNNAGNTPLHSACVTGKAHIVDFILQHTQQVCTFLLEIY